jgi:hypothetical protein
MTQNPVPRSVLRAGEDSRCPKDDGVAAQSRDVNAGPEESRAEKPRAANRDRRLSLCRGACTLVISTIVALAAVLCMHFRMRITVENSDVLSPNVGTSGQRVSTHGPVSSSPLGQGIAITIYSYERPCDLARLLNDIELESMNVHIPVRVHVVDDNALGCAPQIPASDSIFDDFDPLNPALPISQVIPTNPEGNQSECSVLCALHCSSRRRYRAVEAVIARNTHLGWKLFSAHYRHGRRRYWHLVRMAHALLHKHASELDAAYYLFLPDDVRLAKNFFELAVVAWNSVNDSSKLTLMLHIEQSRRDTAVWTDIMPKRISKELHRIGWVESGNFIADHRFMDVLNWSFPRIAPKRWTDNPPISSGVGALLSETIHGAGYSMYLTDLSLVAHVGVKLSKMNSLFREKGTEAHVTLSFADGEDRYRKLLAEASTITASIASVWSREISLHSSVDSLAHQVDHINVYLNGYDIIPSFLRVPHVTAVLSRTSPRGDMGDVGKFHWANDLSTDYHVTADDDMIYPDDYIAKLLQFLNSIQGPAVVGAHGIRIIHERLLPGNGRRGKGYYGSREVFMGTGHVSAVEGVHILGTGALMYRVADFGHIDLDALFLRPNMADVWFGILGQQLSIPYIVIPHAEGWLQEFPGTSQQSLYRKFTRRRNADRHQTAAAIAAAPWAIFSFQPNYSSKLNALNS